MEIQKSIIIDCKKEKLWIWLTEFEKLKIWNKNIVEEQHISNGEVKKGYKTKVLIKEGKGENWYNNEILEYERNNLLRIALSGATLGKNDMTVEYLIKKKGEYAELFIKSHWKPSGLILKLFYPIIKIKATKNTEEVLLELKQQIEK